MQLPPDQMGLQIHQRLIIEEGVLHITCSWSSGAAIGIECFVPLSPNALVIRWRIKNWNDRTRTGHKVSPVWFSLYRWADPEIATFAARFYADYRHRASKQYSDPKATPLTAPSVKKEGPLWFIEQRFPQDPLFKDGFRYLMVPFAPGASARTEARASADEARLHLIPSREARDGWLAIVVPSSSDEGGVMKELDRVQKSLGDRPVDVMKMWGKKTRRDAAAFWSKSRLRIADPLIENLWYETLHARRCAYRADTAPPGLFLPSTVQDYSLWHGDYHTNYNFQQPFWGDYTANHFELGDAYFQGMKFLVEIGRKIAREYYNCRGVFIQLTGYPIRSEKGETRPVYAPWRRGMRVLDHQGHAIELARDPYGRQCFDTRQGETYKLEPLKP